MFLPFAYHISHILLVLGIIYAIRLAFCMCVCARMPITICMNMYGDIPVMESKLARFWWLCFCFHIPCKSKSTVCHLCINLYRTHITQHSYICLSTQSMFALRINRLNPPNCRAHKLSNFSAFAKINTGIMWQIWIGISQIFECEPNKAFFPHEFPANIFRTVRFHSIYWASHWSAAYFTVFIYVLKEQNIEQNYIHELHSHS